MSDSSAFSYTSPLRVAVIGGGPAGLMAAEVLAQGGPTMGVTVDVFDSMPSLGRKFLMAGKGGLNLTHSEPQTAFIQRYAQHAVVLAPLLDRFGATQLRDWAHVLGIETFIGSSGRVFPTDMKAAPLLRAWLQRLRRAGVRLHVRHRWQGRLELSETPHGRQNWRVGFMTPQGEALHEFDAVILALGGGSWPQLGSDGAWQAWLGEHGVELSPLRPANCGFDVAWSAHLRERFAGEAVKSVIASCVDVNGEAHQQQGECVISEYGLEGGLIYALSAWLREQVAQQGSAELRLDLAPDMSLDRLTKALATPRGSRSLASHLQRHAGLKGVKVALLHECLSKADLQQADTLAAGIKSLPLLLQRPRPLAEAISSAGGVRFEGLQGLMLRTHPGVFCAGEMLDWEAPTGGYLLTACFATGHAAGEAARHFLKVSDC